MPTDATRVAHYQRQARISESYAHAAQMRGDKRAALQWARIAQGEREAAEYWASDDAATADSFCLLDSDFDSAWRPPLTLSTESAAHQIGDGWRVAKRGVR